ncbi:M1 family aminopeptidase [Bacteroidota bacterium]
MRLNTQNLMFLVGTVLFFGFFNACKTKEKIVATQEIEVLPPIVTIEKDSLAPPMEYRESNERFFDLIHTALDVRFNWEKQQMSGKAALTLKPYFYPSNKLVLDAKGFELKTVGLKSEKQILPLKYEYDGLTISINLDQTYTRKDTFEIWIDYIAKPEEIKEKGSVAISGAKGLYFINPLGEEKNKPQQIWTQGETEASSCWFPTIDSPNEKITQEISITVDKRFRTLSNGLLVKSKENADGSRTDYWKQTKPHAPYLAMMAVGEFAVVKDRWKDMNVDYYVEPSYEPYAKAIFGETPAMLEFYSNVLNYPYPWDKYSQVVVRDYVSGAMENTSATIHGEFLQKTARELLDSDNERIIAHELFHHWFGDLVTCESWSNLPLNESFATYAEYLWLEHRYGRDAADHHALNELQQYLRFVQTNEPVDLIRFHYANKDDMFDVHSYAKGGLVLHMLRKTIGDDAFFAGLNLYLKKNAFKTVEIHDLRLAMEETTGKDLNWFFNQWFLAKGHPELEITQSYDDNTNTCLVAITQNQDLSAFPLYKIPLDVAIYLNAEVTQHQITITKQKETFEFPTSAKPDLVIVDAEHVLLGTIKQAKTKAAYLFQLQHGPRYLDRLNSLSALKTISDTIVSKALLATLKDPFWAIRAKALQLIKNNPTTDTTLLKAQCMQMAQTDDKSLVRAMAIDMLGANFSTDLEVQALIETLIADQSYAVATAALTALSQYNEPKALVFAEQLAADSSGAMISAIAGIIAKNGGADKLGFFLNAFDKIDDPNDKYFLLMHLGTYLQNQTFDTKLEALLKPEALLSDRVWWVRLAAVQVLAELENSTEGDETPQALALVKRIKTIVSKARETETNETVLNLLSK